MPRRPGAWGVHLYHYSLLLPKQVIEKCDYYATADWARRSGAIEWAEDAYLHLRRPFRVHNVFAYPSWLERFHGRHPDEVVRHDGPRCASRTAAIALRGTDDIERLIDAPWYRIGRGTLRRLDPWDLRARRLASRRDPLGPEARRLGRRARRAAKKGARRVVRVGRRILARRPGGR